MRPPSRPQGPKTDPRAAASRPALRGGVSLPGPGCDPRLLSRTKIVPSVLLNESPISSLFTVGKARSLRFAASLLQGDYARCGSGFKSGHTALFCRSHHLEGVRMPPRPQKGNTGGHRGNNGGKEGSRPLGRPPSVTSGVPALSAALVDSSPATYQSEPGNNPPFLRGVDLAPIRSADRKSQTHFRHYS